MKSKKSITYLLLAGVLVVWGLILWKMFKQEPQEVVHAMSERKHAAEAGVSDTLMLDYRDPFLGGVIEKPVAIKPATVNNVATPQTVETQQPVVVHRLRYLGQISRNGMVYAIIGINGSLHTMCKGEAADDYRLETIWADSVGIRWGKEVHIVKLGN